MSSNFIICIKAVIPMFLMLALGYGGRLMKLTDDSLSAKMNSLCFKMLFPFLMFHNIYASRIDEVLSLRLIVFAVAAVMAVYGAATLFTLRIEKSARSRGAMIQAIYRSNFVIMGLPVATNIYGHGNVGVTAVLVAIIVPLFNVLAVVTLEIYRSSKVRPGKILLNIAKNPLIGGAFLGIAFSILGIRLPGIIESTVSDISACATPVALMILGSSFKFSGAAKVKRNLTIAGAAKLIAVPGLVLPAAALLGFRDIAFVSLVGIFAAPCAISSFTMAQEMDSDYELAGASVVFTTAFSCVTMFLWLYLFKSLGVF